MFNRREAEEAAIARVRAAVDRIQGALARYWENHGTPHANGALLAIGAAQQEFKAARMEMNSLVEDITNGRT